MSESIQSDTNESKCDQITSEEQITQLNTVQSANEVVFSKHQFLVERANITFQELYKTLENEQSKLFELEERRKKLQEEMLILKAEIEEEKQSFNLNIIQSVAENLTALNNAGNYNEKVQNVRDEEQLNIKSLDTCYEEEEERQPITARNLYAKDSKELIKEDINIQGDVQYIRSELQNVLTQCISEQCGD